MNILQKSVFSFTTMPLRQRCRNVLLFLTACWCWLIPATWVSSELRGAEPTCLAYEDFDPFKKWNNQLNWCEGEWLGPTFSDGMMRITPSNNCQVRVRSNFTLKGNFDICVRGECYWAGSFIDTHVKHWLGLYHSGSTSDPNLKLRFGFDGSSEIFIYHTHYAVDLNNLLGAESGATKSFNLKFSKVGNSISIYHLVGRAYVLIEAYDVVNPETDLHFEMASIDCTSYGAGWAKYDQLTAVAGSADPCNHDCTPAPLEACCFPNGGCLELSPSDCATAGGSLQGAGSDCDTAGCVLFSVCPGDLNGDGLINGEDIQHFVNLLLLVGACP